MIEQREIRARNGRDLVAVTEGEGYSQNEERFSIQTSKKRKREEDRQARLSSDRVTRPWKFGQRFQVRLKLISASFYRLLFSFLFQVQTDRLEQRHHAVIKKKILILPHLVLFFFSDSRPVTAERWPCHGSGVVWRERLLACG